VGPDGRDASDSGQRTGAAALASSDGGGDRNGQQCGPGGDFRTPEAVGEVSVPCAVSAPSLWRLSAFSLRDRARGGCGFAGPELDAVPSPRPLSRCCSNHRSQPPGTMGELLREAGWAAWCVAFAGAKQMCQSKPRGSTWWRSGQEVAQRPGHGKLEGEWSAPGSLAPRIWLLSNLPPGSQIRPAQSRPC